MGHVYPCPECADGKLRYKIEADAYACSHCAAEFDDLTVEHDHVLYTGGPPKRITRDVF